MKTALIWGLAGAAVTPLCMFLGWFFFLFYLPAVPGIFAGEPLRWLGVDIWASSPIGGALVYGFYGWLRSLGGGFQKLSDGC